MLDAIDGDSSLILSPSALSPCSIIGANVAVTALSFSCHVSPALFQASVILLTHGRIVCSRKSSMPGANVSAIALVIVSIEDLIC